MVFRLLAAFLISFAATIIVGLLLVPALRRVNAGQSIRQDGPVWHNKKQGTPTMGGLMFIAGVIAACLTAGYNEIWEGSLAHIFVLVFAVVFAAIGLLDDYEKLRKKQNLGLSAGKKFILQLVVAVFFVILMRTTGYLTTDLYIPFMNVTLHIPDVLFYLIAAFAAVGTVNGVNITDGADGLATGVSIPAAICLTLIALLWGRLSHGIIAAALAGGLIAFLFFNFHPAKVFMGDTGAQFIGGAICALALTMDMPLILIPLGMVYLIETLSDIIQVAYFKITRGKRVFKMAPLHHHFELCGWSEYKLFFVFTSVSAVFAVISYFGVSLRY